jgi:hypothetical protein
VGSLPPAPPPPASGDLPAPLRRLSRLEYDNTLRDLLGDTTAPSRGLSADLRDGNGFAAGAWIDTVDAGGLLEVSEAVAARAIQNVPELTACAAGAAGEPACARQVVTTFGRRAYRRPLTAAEVAALEAFYKAARDTLGADHKNAMRLVVQVILQSPSFLYHAEGAAGGVREGNLLRLGPHALAARLSYFLWSSMPDAELFAAADADALKTPAQIEAQARRLLKAPKAADALASFALQWLETPSVAALEKSSSSFTADTARAAADEARMFMTDLLAGPGDGRLATLLTARTTFMNAGLAKLYGVDGVSGSALVARPLDPNQRAGVLTQTAFLATHAAGADSHPVKRGIVVLERLLCEHPPSPPQEVPDPKPPAPNLSTRERFAEHATNAGCAGCHKLFDDIGFAFETYDGLGRFRTMDGGKPVDASGTFTTGGGETFRFAHARELAEALARSPQVRACMTRQWLRFALGREDGPGDAAAIAAVTEAYARKDADLRELLVALTTSRSFLYRTPAAGEVTP